MILSDDPQASPTDGSVSEAIEELAGLNRNFVDLTEMDTDTISRQFVKTQNRSFVTVGKIDCPTGYIIAADPFCYLPMGKYCPQLANRISPGVYPVEVSMIKNPYIGIRVCTARLKITPKAAARYALALTSEQTRIGENTSGFPVETGKMCFCDKQTAAEYKAFIDEWYKHNPNGNHYDDYFADFFAQSYEKLPEFQRQAGDFIEWSVPQSGRRLVMASSGMGSGFYRAFWGYDNENSVCELIVPMINPDIFEKI